MEDYEFLTVDTVADYIRSHSELAGRIDADSLVCVEEVGDGNLNLVFLARDAHGEGLCLKQALPYVRMTGEGWPMTPDRARHEAEALSAHYALTPDLVPQLYLYDPQRYILSMEDLSDHEVWRGALNRGEVHDGASDAVGTYVGALAFGTSLFAVDRESLADRVASSLNPQLCTITEDLVFSEPLVDAGRNSHLLANRADVEELTSDAAMMRMMGYAKWLFMTKAEALIHGDLHTGSVMVRKARHTDAACDSVKAFDSEFAFYGPVAFDLGAVFANYVLAASRAYALGEDSRAAWILDQTGNTWDAFDLEFRRRWPSRVDPRVFGDRFLEDLLLTWRSEAWLFAAAKMTRRIVGAAKVSDVETLPEDVREGAARGVLRTARRAVRQVGEDSRWHHFIRIAHEELRSSRTNC